MQPSAGPGDAPPAAGSPALDLPAVDIPSTAFAAGTRQPASARAWGAADTRCASLIALACFGLPFVSIPYWPTFKLGGGAANLATLQFGALLALAMLAPRPGYFRIGYAAAFLGWCLNLTDFGRAAGTGGMIFRAVPLYVLMYGWTVLCARAMGWPRIGRHARLRQSDILPIGAIAFVLYPLGWGMAFLLVSLALGQAELADLYTQALRVCFSRFFGVLCLTLPILAYFTGRREPAPMPERIPWWEGGLLGSYFLLLVALLLASTNPAGHPLGGLIDQRFMTAALMIWAVLRLPWRWSAPLLAVVTVLLVHLLGMGTRIGLRDDALELLQMGIEMSVLQQLLVLTQVVCRDNRRAVARLAEESRRDNLSQVPNLNGLRHDLAQRKDRPPHEIACLGIDNLDNLLAGFGLPAQDALTLAIHQHLQPDINAYTLGMGRFILVPSQEHACWQAMLARIEQFEFRYADVEVRIEPHLGVAPLREATPEALELALHAAYGAMKDARHHGDMAPVPAQDCADQEALRAVLRTHSLALSLLRKRQIELHIQPIVPAADGRQAMAEILCRLKLDDGQLLMPKDYMEELEASRGVVELDRAVIETLLPWLQAHAGQLPFRRLTVNLTGRSLVSGQFRLWLLEQLDARPGCAGRLCFEITERAISGGLAQVRPLLDGLAQRGCLIALDDFGTGMQSFERLQQLPIHLVKIDGTFIRNIASTPRDRELVRAMVTIARAYQAETVAEYVESAQIREELRSLGVDWLQGYHVGRPSPLELLPLAAPALH
jgi:EAL domain-containing protein (putative c-di-GMP-specific phosphodiesterase class I)